MDFSRFDLGIFKYDGIIESEKMTDVLRAERCCIGGTATKIIKIIKKTEAGVLPIEEAYTICTLAKCDFGKEAIVTLIANVNNNPNHNIKNQ